MVENFFNSLQILSIEFDKIINDGIINLKKSEKRGPSLIFIPSIRQKFNDFGSTPSPSEYLSSTESSTMSSDNGEMSVVVLVGADEK